LWFSYQRWEFDIEPVSEGLNSYQPSGSFRKILSIIKREIIFRLQKMHILKYKKSIMFL